jgi:hypothetical protein
MNGFTFLAIAVIWIVCGYTDTILFALLGTLAVMSFSDSDDEPECSSCEVDYDNDIEVEEYVVPPTKGPVFPDGNIGDKHVHFLEEQDQVGIFAYDRSEGMWTLVGQMPYAEGQKPEVVATVVPEAV